MELFRLLEEQSAMGFMGHVNVLRQDSQQFVGLLTLKDGKIINASHEGHKGMRALFDLLHWVFTNQDITQIVPEPEIVGNESLAMEIEASFLKSDFDARRDKYHKAQALRPPDHLKLVCNPSFIVSGPEIGPSEFELLHVISQYAKVEDIYQNCQLPDWELTYSLVELRKKKAIRVIAT